MKTENSSWTLTQACTPILKKEKSYKKKSKKLQRTTAFTEFFYNHEQFTHWVSIKAEGVTAFMS